MAEKIFDIPGFSYFAEKNHYSGSALKYFNFKIWYGEEFVVKVWYGKTCYSCTPAEEIAGEFTAEFSPESLPKIEKWLTEQLEAYKKRPI